MKLWRIVLRLLLLIELLRHLFGVTMCLIVWLELELAATHAAELLLLASTAHWFVQLVSLQKLLEIALKILVKASRIKV